MLGRKRQADQAGFTIDLAGPTQSTTRETLDARDDQQGSRKIAKQSLGTLVYLKNLKIRLEDKKRALPKELPEVSKVALENLEKAIAKCDRIIAVIEVQGDAYTDRLSRELKEADQMAELSERQAQNAAQFIEQQIANERRVAEEMERRARLIREDRPQVKVNPQAQIKRQAKEDRLLKEEQAHAKKLAEQSRLAEEKLADSQRKQAQIAELQSKRATQVDRERAEKALQEEIARSRKLQEESRRMQAEYEESQRKQAELAAHREAQAREAQAREAARLEALARMAPAPPAPAPVVYAASFDLKPVPKWAEYNDNTRGIVAPAVAHAKKPADADLTLAQFTEIATDYHTIAEAYRKSELRQGTYDGKEEKTLVAKIAALGTITNPAVWLAAERVMIDHNYSVLRTYVRSMPISGGLVDGALEKASHHAAEVKLDIEVKPGAFNEKVYMDKITLLIVQATADHKNVEGEFMRLQAGLVAGTGGVTKQKVNDAEDHECKAKNTLDIFMVQYETGGVKVEAELKTFGGLLDAVYKAEHDLWQHDQVPHFIKGVALDAGRLRALNDDIKALIAGYEKITVPEASQIAFQLLGELDNALPNVRIKKYIPVHDWATHGVKIQAAQEKVQKAHAAAIEALKRKLAGELATLTLKHKEINDAREAKDAIKEWVAQQKQHLSDLQAMWEKKIEEDFKAMVYQTTGVPLEEPPKAAVDHVVKENNDYYQAGLGDKTAGSKSGILGRLDQYIVCNKTMLDTILKKYNSVVDAVALPTTINTIWYKANIENKFTTDDLDMKNSYYPNVAHADHRAALTAPVFPYAAHNIGDKCVFDINEFCPPVQVDGTCPAVVAPPVVYKNNVLYLVAQVSAIGKAAAAGAVTLAVLQAAAATIRGPPPLLVDSKALCGAVQAANTAIDTHITTISEGKATATDIQKVIDDTKTVEDDPVLARLAGQYLPKIPGIVTEMEKYPQMKLDLETALESNAPANLWPKALNEPFKTYAAALRTYRTAYITHHFTHLTTQGTDAATVGNLNTFDTLADTCALAITALTGSTAKNAVAEDFTSCETLPANFINVVDAGNAHKKVTDAWGALNATFEARKIVTHAPGAAAAAAVPAAVPTGTFFNFDLGVAYTQLVAEYNDEIVKDDTYDVKANGNFTRIHDFINTDLRAVSAELIDVADYDNTRAELLKMDAKIIAALDTKTAGLQVFLNTPGALAESRITPVAYAVLAITPAATTKWRTSLDQSLKLFNIVQIQTNATYWPTAQTDCKDDLQNKLPAAFTFDYTPASYAEIQAGYETQARFIADRDAAFNAFDAYDAKHGTHIKNNFIVAFDLHTKAKLGAYNAKLKQFAADNREPQTFVNTAVLTKPIADELIAYVAAYNKFLTDGLAVPSDTKVKAEIAALADEILKTVQANIKPVEDLIQEINGLKAKFTTLSGLSFQLITDALAKVKAMHDKHNIWAVDPQVKNGLSAQMLLNIKKGIHATIDTIITTYSCKEEKVNPDATLPGQIDGYLKSCLAYIGTDATGALRNTDNENSELCAEVLALVSYMEKLPYHTTYGTEKSDMKKFHADHASKFNVAPCSVATSKVVIAFELVYNAAAPANIQLLNSQKQTFIEAMRDEKDFNEIKKYGADLEAIVIDPRLWPAADFKRDVLDVYKNMWYYSGPNVVNAFTHWSTYTIGQMLKLKGDSVHTYDVMAKITECFAVALDFTRFSTTKPITDEQKTVQNEINYLSNTYPIIVGWIQTNGKNELRPYIQKDKYVAMFAPVQKAQPGDVKSFTPNPLIKRLVGKANTPFTPPLNLLSREIYDVESYNLAPLTQWDITNNKYVAEDSKFMDNLFALIGHIPTSMAEWAKLKQKLTQFQSALTNKVDFNPVYHSYGTLINKIIAANADTPIKIGIQCKEYPTHNVGATQKDKNDENTRCDNVTKLYSKIFAGAFYTITIPYIATKVPAITSAYNACVEYINKNLYVYDEDEASRHVLKAAKSANEVEIAYQVKIPRKQMTTGNYARFIYEQNDNKLYDPNNTQYHVLFTNLISKMISSIKAGTWDQNRSINKFVINQDKLLMEDKSCIFSKDILATVKNFMVALTQNMLDADNGPTITEIVDQEKKGSIYLAFIQYIIKISKSKDGDSLENIKEEIIKNIPAAPTAGNQFYNQVNPDENLIDMTTIYSTISTRLQLPTTSEASVDLIVNAYNTTYGADGKFAPFDTTTKGLITGTDPDKIATLLYTLQNPPSPNRGYIFNRLTAVNYKILLPDPATVVKNPAGPGPGGSADPNLMSLGDKSQHILYFRPFVSANNESRMERQEFYNVTHLKNKTVYLSNGSNSDFTAGGGSQAGIQDLNMGFTMHNADSNKSLLDGSRLTLIVKNQKEVKGETKQKYDLSAIPNLEPEIAKVDLYTGTVLLAKPAIVPTGFRSNIAGVYHILGRAYRHVGGDEKKYVGFVSQYYTAILQDYAAKCKSASKAGESPVALHLVRTPGDKFFGTHITKYAFRRAVMKFLEFHIIADNDTALTISVDLPKDIGTDEKSTGLYKYDFANKEPWTDANTAAVIADPVVKEAGNLLIKSLDASSAKQYTNLVRRIHDAAGESVIKLYGAAYKGTSDNNLTFINSLVTAAETAAGIKPGECGDIVGTAPGPRPPSPPLKPPSPPPPVKTIVKAGVITATNSECINGVIVHYVPVTADLSTQPSKKEYYDNYPDAKISISTSCTAAGKIDTSSNVKFNDPSIATFTKPTNTIGNDKIICQTDNKKYFNCIFSGSDIVVGNHNFDTSKKRATQNIIDVYYANVNYLKYETNMLHACKILAAYYAILHHFDTQSVNDVLQLIIMTPNDGYINYLARQAIYKYCHNRTSTRPFIINVSFDKDITAVEQTSLPYQMDSADGCAWAAMPTTKPTDRTIRDQINNTLKACIKPDSTVFKPMFEEKGHIKNIETDEAKWPLIHAAAVAPVTGTTAAALLTAARAAETKYKDAVQAVKDLLAAHSATHASLKTSAELKAADGDIDSIITKCTTTNDYKTIVQQAVADVTAIVFPAAAAAAVDADQTAAEAIQTDSADWGAKYNTEYQKITDRKTKIANNLPYITAIENARTLIAKHTAALEAIRAAAARDFVYVDSDTAKNTCDGWKTNADALFAAIAADYKAARDVETADVFPEITKQRQRLDNESGVLVNLKGLIDRYIADELAYIMQWRRLYQAHQTEIGTEGKLQGASDTAAAAVVKRDAEIKVELTKADTPAAGLPLPMSPTTAKAAVTQAAIDAVKAAVAHDATLVRTAKEAAAKAAAEKCPAYAIVPVADQAAAVASAVLAAVPVSPPAAGVDPDFNALVATVEKEIKDKITDGKQDSPDLEVAAMLVAKVKDDAGAYIGDKTMLHTDLKKVVNAMQAWADNSYDDAVYTAICDFETDHVEFKFVGTHTAYNNMANQKSINFTSKILAQITADTAIDIKTDEYVNTILLVATKANERAAQNGEPYAHTREVVQVARKLPGLLNQYQSDKDYGTLTAALNNSYKHDEFITFIIDANKQYGTDAIDNYAYKPDNYKPNPALLIAGAIMSVCKSIMATLTDINTLCAYKAIAARGRAALEATPWNNSTVLGYIQQIVKLMPTDFTAKNTWFAKCTSELSRDLSLFATRANTNIKKYTVNFIRDVNIEKYRDKSFDIDKIFEEPAEDIGFLIRVVNKFNDTGVTDDAMIHEISECAQVFPEVKLPALSGSLVASDTVGVTGTYTRAAAKLASPAADSKAASPAPDKTAQAEADIKIFVAGKKDPELIAAYELLKHAADNVSKGTHSTHFFGKLDSLVQSIKDWNASKNDILCASITAVVDDLFRTVGVDLVKIPNVSDAFTSEIRAISGCADKLAFDEAKISQFLYKEIKQIYTKSASKILDYFNGKKAAIIIYNAAIDSTCTDATLATANDSAAVVVGLTAQIAAERAKHAPSTGALSIATTDLSKLIATDIYSRLAIYALQATQDQVKADGREDLATIQEFQKLYTALSKYKPATDNITPEIAALVSQANISTIYNAEEEKLHSEDLDRWITDVAGKYDDAPFNFAEEMLDETQTGIKAGKLKAAAVTSEAKAVYDEIIKYNKKDSTVLDVASIVLASKINKLDYLDSIQAWQAHETKKINQHTNQLAATNAAFGKASRCINAAYTVYQNANNAAKELPIYTQVRKVNQEIDKIKDDEAPDTTQLDIELQTLAVVDPTIKAAYDLVAGGGIKYENAYKMTNAATITAETNAATATAAALAAQKAKTAAAKTAFDTQLKAGDALFDDKETARQALVTFGDLATKLADAIAVVTGGNQPRMRYIPRPTYAPSQESSWSFSWLGWLALAVVMCIIIYMLYLIFKPSYKKIVVYNFRPQSGPLYVDKPKGPAYVMQ